MTDNEVNDRDSVRGDVRIDRAKGLIGTRGLWSGQILYTAATLGLFESLGSDPVPASSLADELGLDADHTYRLLRALAHFGVLDEHSERGFKLTRLGELFRDDHPDSVRSDLLFNRSPQWTRSLLHLTEKVREGGPTGFEREYGVEFFDYLENDPVLGERYKEMIEYASRNHPTQVLDSLEPGCFEDVSHVCDVGGGRGHLLCHLLDAYPDLEGTVLELPGVLRDEDGLWANELGVTDRCTYQEGDMFVGVPEADAYILKWILHNFDDRNARRILSNIHGDAPEDAVLYVVETPVPGSGETHDVERLDVAMMVQTGGRERTQEEYRDLLESTGWRFVRTGSPDNGDLCVIEAVRE